MVTLAITPDDLAGEEYLRYELKCEHYRATLFFLEGYRMEVGDQRILRRIEKRWTSEADCGCELPVPQEAEWRISDLELAWKEVERQTGETKATLLASSVALLREREGVEGRVWC